MAKQSGLGDNLYIAGYDVSGDIQSLGGISSPLATLDFTDITQSAMERRGGQRDGSMAVTTFMNDSTDRAHDRLSALPTANTLVSYHRGTALGDRAACQISKQINYDPNRDQAGNLLFSVQAQAAQYGLEWGVQLTAGKRQDTTATNGSSVDFSASTSFGLQAYLHVFSFTGTSAVIKLQESSDDGSGDAFADVTGGDFTTVTGITSERIETGRAQAVERYLRVVTTGTFSECTFAVVVVKNATEVVF